MLLQREIEGVDQLATLGQILVQHNVPQFYWSDSFPNSLWEATPLLIHYGDMETSNSTLDQQLKDRDIALRALKEHLQAVH